MISLSLHLPLTLSLFVYIHTRGILLVQVAQGTSDMSSCVTKHLAQFVQYKDVDICGLTSERFPGCKTTSIATALEAAAHQVCRPEKGLMPSACSCYHHHCTSNTTTANNAINNDINNKQQLLRIVTVTRHRCSFQGATYDRPGTSSVPLQPRSASRLGPIRCTWTWGRCTVKLPDLCALMTESASGQIA